MYQLTYILTYLLVTYRLVTTEEAQSWRGDCLHKAQAEVFL